MSARAWVKHPLRVTGRLLWLGGELALAALRYPFCCSFSPRPSRPAARAAWLHHTSRQLLHVFNISPRFIGTLPARGLLVCNHLSYLDIVVLGAMAPCVFVAKREVKNWPVFGWFARMAGTVFVQREQRAQTAHAVDEIEAALKTGALVVLFPEGTSSGGASILPFKSSLLAPAARQTHPLTSGFIHYTLSDGDVSEEVCYWKDMTLLPHLINLCSKRGVQACVQFHYEAARSTDRKQLALQLHAELTHMQQQTTALPPPRIAGARRVASELLA